MPVGYLVSVAFVACCSAFALAPLRRPRTLGLLSWWLGLVINELPFVAFYWILAATLPAFGQRDIDTAGGWGGVHFGRPDLDWPRSHRVAGMACGRCSPGCPARRSGDGLA
jgi:hypothetical protein